jgi:hypothetical protein
LVEDCGQSKPRELSGYLHASAIQAVGMLGFGRANIRRLARDEVLGRPSI